VSAVCGAIGLDGRPFSAADIGPMLARLRPTGPDGTEVWTGVVGRIGVAVGVARRVRVPADHADAQPLSTPDGQVTVVADVLLDDRAGLSTVLGVADRPEVPDSAFVLAAYQRWGIGCPQRLYGEYAFAVVDARRGGVLLARDHVGARPLLTHSRPGVLAFASTGLGLTGFAGVGAGLDPERVTEYLVARPRTRRSWIRAVAPLPGGHAMWAGADGVRRWCYWAIDPADIDTDTPPEAQVAALRAAIETAVRARSRRTGGLGVLCSGGLDSTSVAAHAAAAVGPEPVRTYTSAPPPGWRGPTPRGTDPDETRLVADLARWYPNLRPRPVRVAGRPVTQGWDELFAHGGTPVRNPCNLMWIMAGHELAAADGVTTLLTGAMGNLFFSADDRHFLVDLIRHGHLGAVPGQLRAFHAAGRSVRTLALELGQELTPPAIEPVLRRLLRLSPGDLGRNRAGLRAACPLRPDLLYLADSRTFASFDPHPARRRQAAVDALAGPAVNAEHLAGIGAAFGLRGADPTAHVPLLELCARQPGWVRRRDGRDRAACRAAIAGRVPDSIRLRTVRGAQLPDWLERITDARAELTAEWELAREVPLLRELVDIDRLDRYVRDWPPPGTEPVLELFYRYRQSLLRTLMVGRYARWLAGQALPVAGGSRNVVNMA
jgi:asparagine synthase (glutamine-hydrolysing)